MGSLSGGEKARLLLALMSWSAPNILLMDEPTNHLDVDSRQALVQAINDFGGAVVLISHDPHLIELCADRLWLVKDGTVRGFDGDLDDYRQLLLDDARAAARGDSAGKKSDRPLPQRGTGARLRISARSNARSWKSRPSAPAARSRS